ncbi:MAG TPA: 16S rRNA (guanine(527)-N(7))-methyltransferase RsmG [Tepidisphaeraceae bacterium]|jgi:16S rRNA (guanine527-N7)-methyltransferase
MNELWLQVAARGGVALTEAQGALFNRYLDLLTEANQRMNLTRIVDRAQAEVQHVADSLTVLPFLPVGEIRVVDVGSGGGVPGLVLAIARPDAQVTLVESTKKKAAFLKSAAEQMGLSNVVVLDQRVEDVGNDPAHREQYDVATARAVATMDWLIEWCVPLVKKGGKFLAMKGPKVREELPVTKKALNMTGGGEPAVHGVELPGAEGHVIVEIEKLRKADPVVPRSATRAKGRALRSD